MDYSVLIRNWHVKAGDEDYFSKFVFEYLAFIVYLKTQLFQGTNSDRSAIQKLKQDQKIKNRYFQNIQSNSSLQKHWDKIISELKKKSLVNVTRNPNNAEEIKWWNCSHDDLNVQTEEKKRKQKGIIHSINDWENMVEFWYGIRNNLFHGSKDPENERDQFLAEYGYRTLSKLMEIFLDENKN